MKLEHVVVWDGRRQGPGGCMLFGPEPVITATPEEPRLFGDITRQARALRGVMPGWFTCIEFALRVGITADKAKMVIHNCLLRGDMEKTRKAMGQRQLYRWMPR